MLFTLLQRVSFMKDLCISKENQIRKNYIKGANIANKKILGVRKQKKLNFTAKTIVYAGEREGYVFSDVHQATEGINSFSILLYQPKKVTWFLLARKTEAWDFAGQISQKHSLHEEK